MAVPSGRMVPNGAAPPSTQDPVVPFQPPPSDDLQSQAAPAQAQITAGRPPLPPSQPHTAQPSTEQNGQAPHRMYASPFQVRHNSIAYLPVFHVELVHVLG